jgi:hypothetical protein
MPGLLVTLLVAHPAAAWRDEGLRWHARALFQAAAACAGHEPPEAVEELRRALVNAGEADAAQL